jgi:hypothetical protein
MSYKINRDVTNSNNNLGSNFFTSTTAFSAGGENLLDGSLHGNNPIHIISS